MPFSLTQPEIIGIATRLITALLGTVAFAIILNVSKNRIPAAAVGGLITYAVYEFVLLLGGVPLICAFSASLFMTLYSEALARILRTPAVMLLIPCAIPIVPGSGLYYTIYNLLFYNGEKLFDHAASTLQTALGIAIGFGIGTTVVAAFNAAIKALRKRQE